MNKKVHCHIPSTGCNVKRVGVEAVHHDSDVMVPVQKLEWLLPQNNERSVSELDNLSKQISLYK